MADLLTINSTLRCFSNRCLRNGVRIFGPETSIFKSKYLFKTVIYLLRNNTHKQWTKELLIFMSTPLGGGYIIFAFSAVRRPMSGVRRPMSGVTHGFRSFKGKVLELLSPNLVCRLIGSVACLGLLLAVVPLLLTE